MFESPTKQKLLTVSVVSIVLTMLTIVLGAPLLRLLRKVYGSKTFWTIGLLVTVTATVLGWNPFSIYVGTVWMTLGVYTELEEKGFVWGSASAISITAGVLTGVLNILVVMKINGLTTLEQAKDAAQKFVENIKNIYPESQIDASAFAQLAPSSLISMLIIALGFGLIFEKSAFRWFNLPRERTVSQLKLFNFRNSDWLIWISLTSFLGTLVMQENSFGAVFFENVIRISTVLYFFQGLAILEVFLISMKAGTLTRVLSYLLLVGPFLSMIGFADYWIDFRRKLFSLKISSEKT